MRSQALAALSLLGLVGCSSGSVSGWGLADAGGDDRADAAPGLEEGDGAAPDAARPTTDAGSRGPADGGAWDLGGAADVAGYPDDGSHREDAGPADAGGGPLPPMDAGTPDAGGSIPPPVCSSRATVASDAPLILYYGLLHTPQDEVDWDGLQPLIVPGLDVVFAMRGAAFLPGDHTRCNEPEGQPTANFTRLKQAGARLAYNLQSEVLRCCLEGLGCGVNPDPPYPACRDGQPSVERTVRMLVQAFEDGWDYVSVDELDEVRWGDGTDASRDLRTVLGQLADPYHHDRKMIFWFKPTVAGISRAANSAGNLGQLRGLFQTCAAHCRKLVFETYPCADEPTGILTTNVVGQQNSSAWIRTFAARLDRFVPGTSDMATVGIGIGPDYLNLTRCDLADFRGQCRDNPAAPGADPHPGEGGLWRQFAAMHGDADHARKFLGVGFYSLGNAVGHPPTYTARDLASWLAELTSWWARPH